MNKKLTDEEIRLLLDFCSFENMREYINFDTYSKLDIFKQDMKFFRKGIVGDFKNYFTPELERKFDLVIENNLKYKGEILDRI